MTQSVTLPPGRYRWVVLGAGLVALAAASAAQYGLPFLVPALRGQGLTLPQAGLVVASPVLGVTLTLVLWGVLADRVGERPVIAGGLAGSALALLGASQVQDPRLLGLLLVLSGASGAAVHAASGRLILGWFVPSQRGLAMGIRQSAQPLGVAMAGLALPRLASDGLSRPLLALALLVGVSAAVTWAFVRDPHRHPLVASAVPAPSHRVFLTRLHTASALLVIPQFTVAAFSFDYLVASRGWSPGPAGTLLAVGLLGGAATRLGVGRWSDRAGSRLVPMRVLALGTATVLLGFAALAAGGTGVAVVALLGCGLLAVSTNGLAFTAVAERVGPHGAGRALGIHNTGQNVLASATPPVLALVVTGAGYPVAFAVCALPALVALLLVPARAETRFTPSGRRRAREVVAVAG